MMLTLNVVPSDLRRLLLGFCCGPSEPVFRNQGSIWHDCVLLVDGNTEIAEASNFIYSMLLVRKSQAGLSFVGIGVGKCDADIECSTVRPVTALFCILSSSK